jgi:hypothetical protein
MKRPDEYLTQALEEQVAQHQAQGYCPLSFDEPGTRFVLRETAERAVAIALADAEKYKTHLVGAVLNANLPTSSGLGPLPLDAATYPPGYPKQQQPTNK